MHMSTRAAPADTGKTEFLGLHFDNCGAEQALKRCLAAATRREPLQYIVTPNVDHVVRLARAPLLRPAYAGAMLCLNDSRVLARLARFTGMNLPALPGVDLTAQMLARLNPAKTRLALIGPSEQQIAQLKVRYGFRAIFTHTPPPNVIDDFAALQAAADFVAETRADLTLICVGSPQQELMALLAAHLGYGRGLVMCVGASIDFLTNTRKRAPLWMQRSGLEWLHRLVTEPKRMSGRYLLGAPRMLTLFLRWALQTRTAPSPARTVRP